MTYKEIAEAISTRRDKFRYCLKRNMFHGEQTSDTVNHLVTFAIETLQIMRDHEEWSPDTTDAIAAEAERLNLTGPYEGDGQFRHIFE